MAVAFLKLDPKEYPVRYIVTASNSEVGFYDHLCEVCRKHGKVNGEEIEIEELRISFNENDGRQVIVRQSLGDDEHHLIMGPHDDEHHFGAATDAHWYGYTMLMYTPA